MISTISRIDVVLNAVTDKWVSTTEIANAVWERGFTWSAETTRDNLRALADSGTIERYKGGRSYYWRTVPAPVVVEPVTDEAVKPEALVDMLQRLAGHLGVPLALLAPPSDSRARDLTTILTELGELDGPELGHLHEEILKRAIRRAAYDMGKALLDVLTGWVEGSMENDEANGRRDAPIAEHVTFLPEDIRRMVNDAARIMGADEPYRPAVQ